MRIFNIISKPFNVNDLNSVTLPCPIFRALDIKGILFCHQTFGKLTLKIIQSVD